MKSTRFAITTSVAVLLGLALVAPSWAATITLEQSGGTTVAGYTASTVDDTYLGNTAHGALPYMITGGGVNGLVGFKDLLTYVPVGSTITSATLAMGSDYSYSSAVTTTVAEVTTNWMLTAAGTNQNNVSTQFIDITNSIPWASGNFSSSDYSAILQSTAPQVGHPTHMWDVTAIVQDMVTSGKNYGFAVLTSPGGEQDFDTSDDTANLHPYLTVNYTTAPVPEPASLCLMGAGLLMLLPKRRRQVAV